ncbi:MAG: hypothetical protein CMN31_19535 [Sandaracinus sp.]|nr:hypothetical protein [Sandaracinus sp.]MBJ73486.1 hypothetical protein [Sandaracinus sp.]
MEDMQTPSGLGGLLDAFRDALYFLDGDGCLLGCNESGRELLHRGDGLRVVRQRLVLDSEHAQARLRDALSAPHRCARSLALSRTEGMSGALAVLPLEATDDGARWVLVVARPDQLPGRLCSWLVDNWRLTPAEARLVVALVRGDSVKEAAARFGVRESTVRVQLQAVFSKTGARRQGELIGRVCRAVPAVRRL